MSGSLEQLATLLPDSIPVLMTVLILERVIHISAAWHPLHFFKALAFGISAKVHPADRQSSGSQQQLAGGLAILFLILPFIFLFYMMLKVVEFPSVFEGLILWMCLSWTPVKKTAANVTKAIEKNNHSLAKARLSPLVLRNTNYLSPMGLYKATVEMVVLRASKEYLAVILYFLCFGSLFMLFYRLAQVLNQCWNPKLSHYRHFGKASDALSYLLDFAPSRLTAMTIMLLGRFKLSITLMSLASKWGNGNSLQLLSSAAAALRVSLGGPVMYNGNKLRRPVIGNQQTAAPTSQSVHQALALMEKVVLIWLLMIVLITILVMIAR